MGSPFRRDLSATFLFELNRAKHVPARWAGPAGAGGGGSAGTFEPSPAPFDSVCASLRLSLMAGPTRCDWSCGHSRGPRESPPPPGAGLALGRLALMFLAFHQEMAAGVFEGHLQLAVAGEALAGVLGHGHGDGVAGQLGDLRTHIARGGQGRMHVAGDNLIDRLSFKGHVAGQGVIERSPQAVHVGMEIFPMPQDFFGRDVVRSAPDGGLVVLVLLRLPGEAEVHELGFAVFVEEDVAWFDVAMEEIALESGLESRGDSNPDIEHVEFGHHAVAQNPAVEAAVIGELKHDVRAAGVFVEGINVDDAGVVERGGRARLAVKAFHHLLVVGHLPFEHLDGDHALELAVEGPINSPHSTRSDDFTDFETADRRGNDHRVSALGTVYGFQRGQITGEPMLLLAGTANRHAQRLAVLTGWV